MMRRCDDEGEDYDYNIASHYSPAKREEKKKKSGVVEKRRKNG